MKIKFFTANENFEKSGTPTLAGAVVSSFIIVVYGTMVSLFLIRGSAFFGLVPKVAFYNLGPNSELLVGGDVRSTFMILAAVSATYCCSIWSVRRFSRLEQGNVDTGVLQKQFLFNWSTLILFTLLSYLIVMINFYFFSNH